jgi:hypothetical protein
MEALTAFEYSKRAQKSASSVAQALKRFIKRSLTCSIAPNSQGSWRLARDAKTEWAVVMKPLDKIEVFVLIGGEADHNIARVVTRETIQGEVGIGCKMFALIIAE